MGTEQFEEDPIEREVGEEVDFEINQSTALEAFNVEKFK